LESLIKENYRPAECNFYIGEIWFHRKKYNNAIGYFKTSMTLYDQANYIPLLLFHSAVSFEKLEDIDNAINFYETLIDVYPDKEESKYAKKNLLKLNNKEKK
jgi:TolA-binding protein